MSNNKQSSVEWYIIERHNIEIQSRLGKISPTQYDEQLIKIEEQAKAMHKSEIIWAHGIKMKGVNNHKCVSGEQYYNETFGGNNEQAMIDYNKMEEEWEMDNYNEIKDEQQ
jgi:hypothetical protein